MPVKFKSLAFICIILTVIIAFSSCDILTENLLHNYSVDGPEIADVYINDQGELIFEYSNGEKENLGLVKGEDGIDGQDGIDGKDGKDGKNGNDGKNGKDGKDGIDGKDGKDGVSGDNNGISSDGNSISAINAVSLGLRSTVSIFCSFTSGIRNYASAGSGVIYRMNKENGSAFIITNYHVVFDPDSNTYNGISDDISVFLYGSEYNDMAIEATYVGGSMNYDIAILHVENSDVLRNSSALAVDIEDSDKITVGESAIAIGNPEGEGISASYGIVSVDSEHITMTAADNYTEVDFRVMRIDTAVNSGNSGGGLFNSEGKLIGIVNAKIIDENVENIGYAIPSNVAISVAKNIIDHCYGTNLQAVQRPLLGITITIDDSKAIYDDETKKIYIAERVIIHDVSNTSIALGLLQKDDELLSISINEESRSITRQHHVIDYMLNARVGDTVTFEFMRDGVLRTASVVITKACITAS